MQKREDGSALSKRQQTLDHALEARPVRHRRSSRLRIDAATLLARAEQDPREVPPPEPADADETVGGLITRLRDLALRSTVTEAELLSAIARFDEREGWRATGCRGTVHWLSAELGYSRSLAYEKLTVARALRMLPTIASLFASGELGWSKVHALSRVATPEVEKALAIAALDLDADGTQRLCDDYRFSNDPLDHAERDELQRERRSLTYGRRADGCVTIRIVLPPETAADAIRCLEHREDMLYGPGNKGVVNGAGSADGVHDVDNTRENAPRPSAPQRRADAFVAMAQASLTGDTDGSATADRYLVVAQVDAEALEAAEHKLADEPLDSDAPLPTPVRAAIAGILGGSISPATARRMACEGSLVTTILRGGEPIAIGRRRRRHTAAQRRAILARDGCCTFPGCGSTRHLDVHHVTLWSEGGGTSVKHGTTLCAACHQRVHDEGWRVTRVPDATPVQRHPAAERLHETADQATREMTRTFDDRRPVFRFERDDIGDEPVRPRSGRASAADATRDRCAEARGKYTVTASTTSWTGEQPRGRPGTARVLHGLTRPPRSADCCRTRADRHAASRCAVPLGA